ncbi:hypothetical protein VP1G_08419 [Cytospora mali]|uniref:TauD/TfdA-like domain-containing protein n=1 Tax=Cytospora mali TaxID=578113 RepID=A0A194VBI7_CYTMA|nr:hypothetical protein VP1G_08419 [Valsa mali var. pyri (nom. inval.)]
MDNHRRLEPFSFEGQKDIQAFTSLPSGAFPLALQPEGDWRPTLQESVDAIRQLATSGELKRLSQEHGGALLLRGLPIRSAEDYSEIAHAFGFVAHEEVGRPPIRTILAKNVKTANEGPPELPIWPHNEYGWSTIHPAWISFCALETPDSGGETPIISGLGLARALQEQVPEFVENLRTKGVKYVYRYGVATIMSTTGASIIDAYGQHVKIDDDEITIRKKVEEEVKRHSQDFEWHEDGSLSVTHVVPIIRKHEDFGLTTWFGNLTSAWGRSKHHGATRPPYRGDDGSYHPPPLYGDGTIIESHYLDLALAIAESSQVLVEWEQGDVVLLDGLLTPERTPRISATAEPGAGVGTHEEQGAAREIHEEQGSPTSEGEVRDTIVVRTREEQGPSTDSSAHREQGMKCQKRLEHREQGSVLAKSTGHLLGLAGESRDKIKTIQTRRGELKSLFYKTSTKHSKEETGSINHYTPRSRQQFTSAQRHGQEQPTG